MDKTSDRWQTPDWLFKQLDEEFNFAIDLCATKENSKCEFLFSDYLHDIPATRLHTFNQERFSDHVKRLDIKCVFMNPPYSNPKPFIQKAWEDSKHCKVVCLVKCDPSTKWWATFWLYNVTQYVYMDNSGEIYKSFVQADDDTYITSHTYNGPKPGGTVRFFPKRIKFDPPKELAPCKEVIICPTCDGSGKGEALNSYRDSDGYRYDYADCDNCSGEGNLGYIDMPRKLSGPTFSSALLIFDRRGL